MDRKKINKLMRLPLAELVSLADKTRARYAAGGIELCSILNAKSGLCGEDCKFCAQAARYHTGAPRYQLKSKAEMVEAARRAKAIGAERFDIVTSGGAVSKQELEDIRDAIAEITSRVGIKTCASLGRLDEAALRSLKAAGLSRYHHNIETSPKFFPKITTTHTFQDRLKTIQAAKGAGLEVCSGGIIGLGETRQDRIEMALLLRKLGVDSVPLNILVPIKGTPLQGRERLSCAEVIRTIAIFRLILKDKIIKFAAGRESLLNDFQALGFLAGANGMLIGGYLTIKGREAQEDRQLVQEIKQVWKK